MLPPARIEAATARSAGDEAQLDQIGLDHLLDRIARLGEARGQRLDAYRAALVNIRDHHEVAPVHRIEAEAVYLQPGERGIRDARIADSALTRLEVDGLGLDAMDRRYLMMIADIYKGGPVGVETLAAGLSEPRDTIEEVIEPYLIQLGLIARTARGRCLNAGGWKHLGLNPPAASQDGLFDA